MFVHTTQVRVRYGETDQMGYAYYGVYAQYYEIGRVEALRSMGVTYKQLEDDGTWLPVHTFNIVYHKPAFYDDLLTIKTTIPEMPTARIRFLFEVKNAKGELLNEGEVVLVFVNKESKKPGPPPVEVYEKLKKHF